MKPIYFIPVFLLLSFLGAYIRFFTADSLNSIWSTMLVNVSGCFIIGIFFSLKQNHFIDDKMWLLMSFAFIGALTTFSSYILDIFKLILDKNYILAFKYLTITHMLAVLFCVVGYSATNKLLN